MTKGLKNADGNNLEKEEENSYHHSGTSPFKPTIRYPSFALESLGSLLANFSQVSLLHQRLLHDLVVEM